ncbi:hypothetical protein [Paenibacillus sp. BT-177]|uniref:hypothetical protein n=1 Tax=Paenibacillus sp. BT-177 TaxID=2986930 RepID=UPI0021F717FF|nr:hypothetical protein [Paenibacillus sp. BT-177]
MADLSQEDLLGQIKEIRLELEKKEKKVTCYLRRSYKIEKMLIQDGLNPENLLKLQYKIIKLKRAFNDTDGHKKRVLIYSLIGLIFLYGFVAAGLNHVPIQPNKSQAIKINELTGVLINLLLFITVGAIGGITYSLVNEFYKHYKTVYDAAFRMLLAIMFPVVFICLFKFDQNGIASVYALNMLFFACGFSTEFLLLLFNKIVNTAKKAVGIDPEKDQEAFVKLQSINQNLSSLNYKLDYNQNTNQKNNISEV